MWIFTKLGFASAVENFNDSNQLVVRFRCWEDACKYSETLGTTVLDTPDGDYRYRLATSKEEWGCLLSKFSSEIDYPNFKSAVLREDSSRSVAYHRVWEDMLDFQLSETAV
jgi:hypothetical protein